MSAWIKSLNFLPLNINMVFIFDGRTRIRRLSTFVPTLLQSGTIFRFFYFLCTKLPPQPRWKRPRHKHGVYRRAGTKWRRKTPDRQREDSCRSPRRCRRQSAVMFSKRRDAEFAPRAAAVSASRRQIIDIYEPLLPLRIALRGKKK